MHVSVKWIDGVSFIGESETGHAVVMDGAPENGGRNIGMRPMEMCIRDRLHKMRSFLSSVIKRRCSKIYSFAPLVIPFILCHPTQLLLTKSIRWLQLRIKQ